MEFKIVEIKIEKNNQVYQRQLLLKLIKRLRDNNKPSYNTFWHKINDD